MLKELVAETGGECLTSSFSFVLQSETLFALCLIVLSAVTGAFLRGEQTEFVHSLLRITMSTVAGVLVYFLASKSWCMDLYNVGCGFAFLCTFSPELLKKLISKKINSIKT